MSPAQHNEQTRLEVLGYLAQRQSIAQTSAVIHRIIKLQYPCEEQDVRDACTFLTSKGYLTPHVEGLGSSLYYQATAEGVLAWERR